MTMDSPRGSERVFRVAMTVALVGLAAWFFGNAYEEVVIVPNLAFGDVQAGLVGFRAFFRATNPVVYYAILGPPTAVATVVSVLASGGGAHRRVVLRAVACVVPAVLLTAWRSCSVCARVASMHEPAKRLRRALPRCTSA